MPPPSTLLSKLKVQLKLSISRLRMTQQKDSALAKQQRRAMAQLVEEGKLESARIRIENIIRSDIATELHEILELYCELLLARSQLLDTSGGGSKGGLDTVDPGLEEAVRSIVYAAPRTEIRELHSCRGLLVEKFGKDFAVRAMEGEGVPERVLGKLKVETPGKALVEAYLREICKTYGVRFPGEEEEGEGGETVEGGGLDDASDDDDENPSGGQKVKALEASVEAEELSKATPPRKLGPASPLRINPPSPSTENVAPRVKVPGTGIAAKRKPSGSTAAPVKKKDSDDGPGGKIPDVDELTKRFAQLKR